jgi:hypothetical protein
VVVSEEFELFMDEELLIAEFVAARDEELVAFLVDD